MLRAAGEAAGGRGVVIFVDGIDRLKSGAGVSQAGAPASPSSSKYTPAVLKLSRSQAALTSRGLRSLRWLPDHLHMPPHVHLLISCGEGSPPLATLPSDLVAQEISVGTLPRVIQGLLMQGLVRAHGRLLSIDHERSLVTKQAIGSPLFIMAACEEMRCVLQKVEYKCLLQEIRNFPHSVAGMYNQVLQRLEDEHGSHLVGQILSSILLCHGLYEEEIIFLMDNHDTLEKICTKDRHHPDSPNPVSSPDQPAVASQAELELHQKAPKGACQAIFWPCLYRSLCSVLVPRSSQRHGIVTFLHEEIGEVVRDRYLYSRTAIDQVHKDMVVVLSSHLFTGRGAKTAVLQRVQETLAARAAAEPGRARVRLLAKRWLRCGQCASLTICSWQVPHLP
jgi:hypothetical protein